MLAAYREGSGVLGLGGALVSELSASSDTVGAMPASASASASSASAASADWASVTFTIRRLVAGERGASGQLQVSSENLGAGGKTLDRDDDLLRNVGGLGLDRDGGLVDDDERVRGGLALDVEADVDGDLLAAADEHEVDVLDGVLDRVTLNLLRAARAASCRRRRWRAARWRPAAPAESRGRAA